MEFDVASAKIAIVEWVDSKSGHDGWEYTDDLDVRDNLPPTIWTVGFVLDDNDYAVAIVPTAGGGQVLGRLIIPKTSILRIRHIPIEHMPIADK